MNTRDSSKRAAMPVSAQDRPALDAIGIEIYERITSRLNASTAAAQSALVGYDALDLVSQRARFKSWIDGCLQRQHELPTQEAELVMAMTAAKTHLTMAGRPLQVPPDIFGDYELADEVVEPEEGSKWASNITQVTPNLWEQYLRVKVYAGIEGLETLRSELLTFAVARPAHGPWVHVVLDIINSLPPSPVIYLSYAGITIANSPTGRILEDLNSEVKSFFASFAVFCAQVRRQAALPSSRWQVWRLRTSVACTPLELRGRPDLQMAERVAIAAVSPSLNSAPGGFYHRPCYPDLLPAAQSELLAATEPDQVTSHGLQHIRRSVGMWLTYSRQVWSGIAQQGPPITELAFEAAVENASAVRVVPGTDHVLSVMIGKDNPIEDHQATDPDIAGFYARKTGPGPDLSLLYRCASFGCSIPEGRSGRLWDALVGGFIDLWCITLVHLLIWLAILCLIGYFRHTRPLLTRVQSAKVNNIIISGVLGSLIREDPESLAYVERFFNRQHVHISALRSCITSTWLGRKWQDLIPPDWVVWIGTIAVCPTGPGGRDWTIVVVLGDDGRHKYDPYIAEELGRLSFIAQLRAARAELLTLRHASAHPPPVIGLREYLVHLRSLIEDDLEVLYGEQFRAAREDVRRKQYWLGRNRKPANAAEVLEVAAGLALEDIDDGLRERLSQGGRQARANDALSHIRATGTPWSVERFEQWEEIVQTCEDLESRGLGHLRLGPPRPARCIEMGTYATWWQSRQVDCNMVRAAQRDDQAQAQAQAWTPTIGQAMWQAHFGAYHAAHPPPPNFFTSKVTLLDALATALRNEAIPPNRRDRILHCILCNNVEITSYNGGHTCEHHGGDLMPTSASAMGVMTFRIHDAEALLANPLVGVEAWKRRRMDAMAEGFVGEVDDEQEATWLALADADWEEALAARGIAYTTLGETRSALHALNQRYAFYGQYFDVALADSMSPSPYDTKGSISAVLTQVGRSYIRAKSSKMDYHLQVGKDIESNDDALWASGTVQGLLNCFTRTSPIFEVVCSMQQPCTYTGLHYRTMPHVCSSVEREAGRSQTRRTERFAVSFHELPAVWQLRLWTLIRCEESDGWAFILGWQSQASAAQLQQRLD